MNLEWIDIKKEIPNQSPLDWHKSNFKMECLVMLKSGEIGRADFHHPYNYFDAPDIELFYDITFYEGSPTNAEYGVDDRQVAYWMPLKWIKDLKVKGQK